MKIIDEQLLNATTAKARTSPRYRINHNFHEDLNDPINRFLNAMEPETYVRPHRHLDPAKDEIFLILRGKVLLFEFDEAGNITGKQTISPAEGVYGAELKAGIWHSVLVLEPGTVMYEIKQGPFVPLAPDDLAPWSPAPEDTEAVTRYREMLLSHC